MAEKPRGKVVEGDDPEEEETKDERYYIVKDLHLHNCQGIVILQQGQPQNPPVKPPGGGS